MQSKQIIITIFYMKGKFIKWWSTIPPISTKRTIPFHTNSLNTQTNIPRHITWLEIWLGTGTKYGGLNRLMVFQLSPLDNWIINCIYKMCKQTVLKENSLSIIDKFKTFPEN